MGFSLVIHPFQQAISSLHEMQCAYPLFVDSTAIARDPEVTHAASLAAVEAC
jgi:hypothetical protein